jgi:hypothetical protein
MEFKDCFEKVLTDFGEGSYRPEIEKAKYEFFAVSGTVHEDSPSFLERINLFLDWYVFDRKLDNDDLTPLEFYWEKHLSSISDEDKKLFEGMKNFVSGVFFVLSVNSERVKVKDFFTGEVYVVQDNYVVNLVNKGDIFQGRLIPLQDKNIFSRGFCFHPPETVGYIKAEVKKIKNMGHPYHTAFMARLALMRLKTEEYSHVPVDHIYSEEPKIRF